MALQVHACEAARPHNQARVVMTNERGRLSRDDVERMVVDGERYRDEAFVPLIAEPRHPQPVEVALKVSRVGCESTILFNFDDVCAALALTAVGEADELVAFVRAGLAAMPYANTLGTAPTIEFRVSRCGAAGSQLMLSPAVEPSAISQTLASYCQLRSELLVHFVPFLSSP